MKKEKEERYNTREKRVEAVREIGKLENSNIYKHADLLCQNQDRHLSDIDIAGLLSERNPVLVSFLEEICMPNTGYLNNTQYLAHAIKLIYSAKHPEFVSTCSFISAVQVILFSLTTSLLI